MLAIPVLDLKSGRCVHTQTKASKQKVRMDNPIELCAELVGHGAKQIQIVDVDAIRNRQPEHLSLMSKIKQQFPEVTFQVSGGVCSSEDIQIWLDSGADLVTVGGRLLRQQDELELILVEMGKHLVIGMDVRATIWQQGYCPSSELSFDEWVEALIDEDVAALMFTEIPDTGHVNGHSLMAANELASKINLPVIAHGGVHSRHDLLSLSNPNFGKLHGVTVGKPMFEGLFSYPEAVSMLTH